MTWLENLAEQGVKVLVKEEVHRKARNLVDFDKKYQDEDFAQFALYGGKDAVFVFYSRNLGEDVISAIKINAFTKINSVIEYDAVKKILFETEDDLSIPLGGPCWIDNPIKANNREYLREIALKMETCPPKSEWVNNLERKYKFKLKPISYIEEANEIRRGFLPKINYVIDK
jgi:hypothetical protein